MSSEQKKVYALVSAEEQGKIARTLLAWLNKCPDKPTAIEYEFLSAGKPSLALSTIQGSYKLKEYIMGGYLAAYQFKIIYRAQPGRSNNKRLEMDEVLDKLADWAVANRISLVLGTREKCKSIKSNTRSSVFGRYENGDEDHQILMTMTYEVI